MALATRMYHCKSLRIRRLSACIRSFSCTLSARNASRDSSRDAEELRLERGSDFVQGTSLTASFPSQLLARLLGGGCDSVKGGVGGVGECEMIAARADLLASLRETQTHLLSPEKAVSILCRHYEGLRGDMERRLALISVLASDLAVNPSTIQDSTNKLAQLYQEGRSEATLLRSESSLRQVLTPFYCNLFTEISRVDGGMRFLVNLRADILEQLKAASDHSSIYLLSEMSGHLRELLSHWFSPSLLDMEQLTWESPCDIMERVSDYEAVHRLRHWKDLKRRVGRHRRCFIFTHRSLPREPLVILHVALTSEPSNNIKALLNRSTSEDVDLNQVTTAVFYSISSTQKGLSGIDLGYFIIQRVVNELQREFPGQLTTFVTLSPIPGFRRWLESRVKQSHLLEPLLVGGGGGDVLQVYPEASSFGEALQMALSKRDWVVDKNGAQAKALQSLLLSLCARYLVQEKRRSRALDPVAHFHLSGGASVWRLNWLADVSPAGLNSSCGIMCNYLYSLPELNANSGRYRVNGEVCVSDNVRALLHQN